MDIDWINICREGLRAAAGEIMDIYHSEDRGKELSIGQGGDMTLLADKRSEDIVIDRLREERAEMKVVSEERGEIIIGKVPQYTILLDPLDGSFNFKNGLSYFGISMAVMDRKSRLIAGYVLDVSQGTEYYATADGSRKNGKKIQASKRDHAGRILLEYTRKADPEDLQAISSALSGIRHVRAPGAVALDLCGVADGTFDCLLQAGSSRYLDTAAGVYILERAGGLVSDFKGNRNLREGTELKTMNLLASGNEAIHQSILARMHGN